jgi:hypothetical protein
MAKILVVEKDKEIGNIIVSYLKVSLGIRRADITTAKSHWTAIYKADDNSSDLKIAIVGKISWDGFFGDEQNVIYVLEHHFPEVKVIYCTGKEMIGRGINVPRPDKESIGQVIRNMDTVKDILLETLV